MHRVAVHGAIDAALAHRVALEIRSAAGRPIDLRINSLGGAFHAAVTVALEAEEHNGPVFTTIEGVAFSAACIIALAGDERRVDRAGRMMAHFPAPPSREAAAEMCSIVRHYTGQPLPAVACWLTREKIFSADEAVQYGWADRIVDTTAADPIVRLRMPPRRRHAAWLAEYRALYDRCDLRVQT